MISKEIIADMLSTYPLYKSVEVDTVGFSTPENFERLTFQFYCPIDKRNQSFILSLEPKKILDLVSYEKSQTALESFSHATNKYHFIHHFSALCQHCKTFKAHFFIHLESNKSLAVSASNATVKNVIKKIGQYPPYSIKPEKYLLDFLNDEDKENYSKSLICRSQNYGVAAFAYLRRIVENEIIRIISALAQINNHDAPKINALLKTYELNHQMSSLIEGVYEYLPNSLKFDGENPLKLLYSQLSEGIHSFSEEECSQRAELIDTLLKFVIKKINEEDSEVKAAKEAMKLLRR